MLENEMKPNCENCVANHIECAIKAILRDHLIEYYTDSSGQVDIEDWEKEKIDFSQWNCSRWKLHTQESHKEAVLQAFASTGRTPPADLDSRLKEQVKDLPLSLLSAAELNDLQKPKGPWTAAIIDQAVDLQGKNPLQCPACGNDFWQHGPRGGLAENIRCTKCGRIYNTELTGLVLVGRDMTNLPRPENQCPNCGARMDETVHIDSDGYADPEWACRNCNYRENRKRRSENECKSE